MDETALVAQEEPTALAISDMPSIAAVRQKMTWMIEFRKLLIEYVEQQMDPARHMYTFAGAAYTRITNMAQVKGMLAKGQKPALNQDGIHNLMSLYECDIADEQVEEAREDGFYTVRVTLRMRYWGRRSVVGVGLASTRESKYAYRWVNEWQVPKGVDKTILKAKEFDGERGSYWRYRLDNEDVADVEPTVLQMAYKRAKSSAVKSLPGFSEMFASAGDPDEDTDSEQDAERQEYLTVIRGWLKGMKQGTASKALLAVFGEPLRLADVPKCETEALSIAAQKIAIATHAGLVWDSPTLVADLREALQASAARAKADLFGEPMSDTPPAERGGAKVAPSPSAPSGSTQAADAKETPSAPQKHVSPDEPGWKQTLRAQRGTIEMLAVGGIRGEEERAHLEALLEAMDFALSPLGTTTDSAGLALAAAVLEWVGHLEE